MGQLLAERAYAKINLTLDVLNKRNDGYHDIEMVMQTVDLSDLIWLDESSANVIEVESSASNIPLDGRNLAAMAARSFREYCGIQKGLRIRIEKQIPVAAGLAGGSADAAAVLRGLNRLWDTGLSTVELAQIGASVGSDVPFCVYGGCAVARGRGERISSVQHGMKPWVVLTRPPVYVSTADVYNSLTSSNYVHRVQTNLVVEALCSGDFESLKGLVSNGLAETTMRLYPEVRAFKERVEHITKAPVYMSGSGPTLFCLVPSQSQAQRLYNALRGFTKEVYLSRFI